MNDRDGLEEERRLMYVAITRARKRLYLSHSQTRMLHGQTRYNLKSRFFEELPEACLKWLTPKQAPAPVGGSFGAAGGYGGGFGGNSRYRGNDYANNSIASNAYATGATGLNDHKIARRDDAGYEFRVNQKVFHAKFGEGTVLTLEGAGSDARAQINFPRHGVKWLALSVAKLTAVT